VPSEGLVDLIPDQNFPQSARYGLSFSSRSADFPRSLNEDRIYQPRFLHCRHTYDFIICPYTARAPDSPNVAIAHGWFTRRNNIFSPITSNNLRAIHETRATGIFGPSCYLPVEKPDVPVMCRRTKQLQSSRLCWLRTSEEQALKTGRGKQTGKPWSAPKNRCWLSRFLTRGGAANVLRYTRLESRSPHFPTTRCPTAFVHLSVSSV
jgi:hypothetical protein